MSATNSQRRAKPLIQWEEDFDTNSFFCKVCVPRSWLMEASEFKRRLKLWWWLTKLSWTLPK